MTLKSSTELFRYCICKDIPITWDASFKNPEYVYNNLGSKNQIGAYFFYLNSETADNVSEAAIRRMKKQSAIVTKTKCLLIREVNLLDISQCEMPINILNVLYDNGINCLTDVFNKYDKDKKISFSTVSGFYDIVKSSNLKCDILLDCKKMEAGIEINNFFNNNKNFLGQLLTDFDNGVAFKVILRELGFDGYLFDEEKTSPTVCLFDSSCLTEPEHTKEYVVV